MSSSDESQNVKDLFFELLEDQIDTGQHNEDADAQNQAEEKETDANNNQNESWNIYISPEEHLRRQREEEIEQEKAELENKKVKVKHPDEIFDSKENQMLNLKLKVAVEYFHQLGKEHAVTAMDLSTWLYDYAEEYNLKVTDPTKNFEPLLTKETLRLKVTNFLTIRKKRKKSLLVIAKYNKVDLNQKIYKYKFSLRNTDRQEEIDNARESREYNENPNIYPLNPARGNTLNIFIQK